jgi:hypothetical protein
LIEVAATTGTRGVREYLQVVSVGDELLSTWRLHCNRIPTSSERNTS